MSPPSPARLYGCLAIGVIALGWSAILIRLAEAPPLAIAAYRMAGGAALLLPFTGRRLPAAWRSLTPRERALWLAAAVFLAVHFSLWIKSLSHTSVASSVVLVTTNPVFAGLGGWLLLREREGGALWVGVAFTLLGGLLLVWSDARAWSGSGWGNFLALAGAVMASAYLLCGRRLRGRLPLAPYVTVCYGVSGLLLFAAAWGAGQPLASYSDQTWLLLAAMVLGPTLIGHTSINDALGYMPPGKVALAIVGEPVIATALAWHLLAEALTPERAAAAALIL
ncbi:MAG: DMT family transporter, partial [bacterium]